MSKRDPNWMSEEEYLLVTKFTPVPTVNLVILRDKGKQKEVLLIVRKTGYNMGRWCMIGGRVWKGENLEKAVNRQAADLGVKVKIIHPFNGNFPSFIDDRKNQDKTKHPCSLVYPTEIISGDLRNEGAEYKGYKWFSVEKLPKIAFGQKLQILKTLEKLKEFAKG